MKPAVRRVTAALAEAGVHIEPIEFAESTRTAEDAARALGVEVGEIVKSLVFLHDGNPVLVLVSGANRASVQRLEAALGGPVTRAGAETVRSATGYAIGGVPPLGHPQRLPTLIDADLMQYKTVYAASGSPHSVFPIDPAVLVVAAEGRVLPVREE